MTKKELMKKIIDLERELHIAKDEKKHYETRLEAVERINILQTNELNALSELKPNTPKDCAPGDWCKVCLHAVQYTYHEGLYGKCNTAYYCNRNNVCSNFVNKEACEK